MITRWGEWWAAGPVAFTLALAALAYLAVAGVRLSVLDIRTHRLPNAIVLPSYAVAGVLLAGSALAAGAPGQLWRIAGAGLALGLFYWGLHALYPAGMGLGDVKLAGVLGMYLGFLGWGHVVAGAAAGFVLGGLWGVALIASGRGTAKTHIPFGPFMLSGAAAALVLLPG